MQVTFCAGLVPTAARLAIEKQYPKFRLPNEADYNPVDIKDGQGGVQCLGIAKGTYHRGGGVEYALNITSTTAPHTLLVVAYRSGAAWQVEMVWDWGLRRWGVCTPVPRRLELTREPRPWKARERAR